MPAKARHNHITAKKKFKMPQKWIPIRCLDLKEYAKGKRVVVWSIEDEIANETLFAKQLLTMKCESQYQQRQVCVLYMHCTTICLYLSMCSVTL